MQTSVNCDATQSAINASLLSPNKARKLEAEEILTDHWRALANEAPAAQEEVVSLCSRSFDQFGCNGYESKSDKILGFHYRQEKRLNQSL